MWVSVSDKWIGKSTPLEKFFFERIIQRCDYEETISNKHRTVNGYVQLKELIKLSELTYKRERTVRTLRVIIEEAKSNNVSQNICNDVLISKYFQDLKTYISSYNPEKIIIKGKGASPDLTELKKLLHELKIFETQLDQHYFSLLQRELNLIDFSEKINFERNAKSLSHLIDLLIPFLLFDGYTVTTISEVARDLISKRKKPTHIQFLKNFNFNKREFRFLICFEKNTVEVQDFIAHLKFEYPNFSFCDKTTLNIKFLESRGLNNYEIFINISTGCIDPIGQIRKIYDTLLKRIVIQKERASLFAFNNFFEKCFWGFPNKGLFFRGINLQFDPINVNARNSTFRATLSKIASIEGKVIKENDPIEPPKNETLYKAIYYYNSALGSKSIENSLSLLWTSIEALLPYRIGGNDIGSIQYILGKSLSIGAFARDIAAFASRFKITNYNNSNKLKETIAPLNKNTNSSEDLKDWFDWIKNSESNEQRFKIVADTSDLLAFQFSNLGRPVANGKLEYLLKRINDSEESIKYQLQRIYLHRNQIVHAGDMVNEYSNLWLHLEWYVGKLLSYSYYYNHYENKSVDSIFKEIEGDHRYMISYLTKNKNKKIKDCGRIMTLMFKHYWQAL